MVGTFGICASHLVLTLARPEVSTSSFAHSMATWHSSSRATPGSHPTEAWLHDRRRHFHPSPDGTYDRNYKMWRRTIVQPGSFAAHCRKPEIFGFPAASCFQSRRLKQRHRRCAAARQHPCAPALPVWPRTGHLRVMGHLIPRQSSASHTMRTSCLEAATGDTRFCDKIL